MFYMGMKIIQEVILLRAVASSLRQGSLSARPVSCPQCVELPSNDILSQDFTRAPVIRDRPFKVREADHDGVCLMQRGS